VENAQEKNEQLGAILVPADYRQPTVKEAAWLIAHSLDDWYRARCLDYWLERYGAAFVAQVTRKVKPREELLP